MFLLFQRGIFSGLNQLCLELLHKSPHRWIQHCLPAVGFSHLPQHHGHIFHIALNLKLMLYETCDGKNVSKQIWYLKRKGCQTVWGKNVWGLTPQLHILHKLSRSRLQNIGCRMDLAKILSALPFSAVNKFRRLLQALPWIFFVPVASKPAPSLHPRSNKHCLASSSIFMFAMKSAESNVSGRWPC